jgi:hypothetical protein
LSDPVKVLGKKPASENKKTPLFWPITNRIKARSDKLIANSDEFSGHKRRVPAEDQLRLRCKRHSEHFF